MATDFEEQRRILGRRVLRHGSHSILGWCCFGIACALTLFVPGQDARAAKLELVVPAYFYPSAGSPWTKLNTAASKVPITAIMNPGQWARDFPGFELRLGRQFVPCSGWASLGLRLQQLWQPSAANGHQRRRQIPRALQCRRNFR